MIELDAKKQHRSETNFNLDKSRLVWKISDEERAAAICPLTGQGHYWLCGEEYIRNQLPDILNGHHEDRGMEYQVCKDCEKTKLIKRPTI